MKIIRTVTAAQKLTTALRSKGKAIGFVPTMGYLHEGHLSLVKAAKRKSDVVIVSIFVNPLQFGANEDLSKYPRNFKRDEALCRKAGVNYIFYPDVKELYPAGYSTYVNVENITSTLEGKIRPEHFRGVTTVVLKLFNIVQPNITVFGQKDAQQAAVIRKMIDDLNVNIKFIVSPTVREKDGLAMSSRNVYLTPAQRKDAAVLNKALRYAKQKVKNGYKGNVNTLRNEMSNLIVAKPTVTKIDYIAFNNNLTLEEVKTLPVTKELLISLAVRFGKVRLIDNVTV